MAQLEKQLVQKIDTLEQYSRRNNLRLYGIPNKPGENTDELVMQVCKEKLNIDITSHDIDCSHRLNVSSQKSGPKPIIVKFVRRNIRNKISENKRKLAKTNIVIREDLTQRRAALLREVSLKFGKKQSWTLNGNVFSLVDGKKTVFSDIEDLLSYENN